MRFRCAAFFKEQPGEASDTEQRFAAAKRLQNVCESTELVTAHRYSSVIGLHHFDEVKMSMFFFHVAVDSDVDFIKCKYVIIICFVFFQALELE